MWTHFPWPQETKDLLARTILQTAKKKSHPKHWPLTVAAARSPEWSLRRAGLCPGRQWGVAGCCRALPEWHCSWKHTFPFKPNSFRSLFTVWIFNSCYLLCSCENWGLDILRSCLWTSAAPPQQDSRFTTYSIWLYYFYPAVIKHI